LALALHRVRVVNGQPPAVRTPLSTYRLQFNSRFTFRDALAIVDYLQALGISDCYASSYLKAVPGSTHGYDVADPTRLNLDLGNDGDYWAWIDTLHSRGMGHVLDLVPNHMGIGKSSNPWWQDVLENGASSRFASFFDIEWNPVKTELANKVLLPILGDQYGAVLERQELKLQYRAGTFVVHYYEDVLPIAPDTYGDILQPELDRWLADRRCNDLLELQSIVTASRNLPSRTRCDSNAVATRATEKEIVKHRLDALADRSEGVRLLIDAAVRHLNGVAGQARSFDALDRLLNEQSYRLAHWRVASEEINYRRFFDVNWLAALRMEDPAVFEEVHRFVFELVRRGAATGLRVDHVDGLYAPADYLSRLQARAKALLESPLDRPLFLVVEKILAPGEELPDWPVHGTTGYEFAAVINNLFVDGRNERALEDIYTRFIRERRERSSFAELAYRSKKQVTHETMSGDINSLGHQLSRFTERNRHFRDFTLYSLISTLKDIIACFPVYRTYVTPDQPISESDRQYITQAIQCAKRRAAGVTSVVFDFVERLLLKQTAATAADECRAQARFVGKFQQITSPVAAKGIEDTAFYVYNRLLSLNEVGSDPTRFGLEPQTVHAWLAERQRRWPAALSTTATHDTKRGEDVRARLNVLSEIPGAWNAAVVRWRALNRRHKTEVKGVLAPGANEEYLFYQTLVAAWPFTGDHEQLRARMRAYMTKALREAKVHTSWLSPDEEYERATNRFVDLVLDYRRSHQFFQAFLPFQAKVAELGIYNGLAQLLIKITAPGVPDFYQGTELWDLNLVDPDNRRPVDYETRRRLLQSALGNGTLAAELLEHRSDGRVKLFVTAHALAARARFRQVFEHGEYVPLATAGARRECLFAFARRSGTSITLTAVPRLVAALIPDAATPPVGRAVWSDTRVELREGAAGSYCDAFTGTTIEVERVSGVSTIAAATMFGQFPVALLTSTGS